MKKKIILILGSSGLIGGQLFDKFDKEKFIVIGGDLKIKKNFFNQFKINVLNDRDLENS